jgi:hypothetical protein
MLCELFINALPQTSQNSGETESVCVAPASGRRAELSISGLQSRARASVSSNSDRLWSCLEAEKDAKHLDFNELHQIKPFHV